MRGVLALVGAVATLAALPAQQQSPQTAPAPAGVIVGQIVDAGSGKPVPNANVLLGPNASAGLVRLPIGGGGPPAPMRALTNAEGRFIFRPLSKGAYSVTANASGYIFGTFGQTRPNGPSRQVELDDNAAIETITVRMWKYASIGGTVIDEKAEPAVGITVRVLQQVVMGGRRRLVQGATAQTDDRGMYRISSLSPGDYFVVVPFSVTNVPTTTVDGYQQSIGSTAPWDITPELRALGAPFTGGVRIGDQQIQISAGRSGGLKPPSAPNGRFLSYQVAFYPTGSSLSQATAITLGSGEERASTDIQLRLVPTLRVTGSARTAYGPAKFVNVRLVPADVGEFGGDFGLEAATTGADSEGRFTFLAVPSGQYLVKVQTTPAVRDWDGTPIDPEPTLWASQPLTVGDRDPLDLSVLVHQGFGVSGRFEFESTGTPRPPADRVSALTMVVLPNDRGGTPFNTTAAAANADGQFVTPKYAPGRYTLLINSPGPPWTIKSAAVAGREVPLDGLDLGTDDIKDLIITFVDQSTELAGTVRDDAAMPGAAVCIFPFDYQEWIANGMSSRRSRTVALSKSNGFTIRDLAPGDYVVVAVPSDVAVDLQDPKWIARLAPLGMRVSIKTGEKKRQDLTASRIR